MHSEGVLMLPRTTFLSRVIGIYCLIFAVVEATHRTTMIETTTALTNAPASLFLAGAFTLLLGAGMVVGHNVWSGGAAPVVVTIVGWAALLKGAGLMFLSQGQAAGVLEVAHFADLYYFYTAITLVLGLYLTYAGFSARRP
jgi:hypothetical protein